MKLSYFNMRGRAETSRLMLAQAGVEFEDCRWEFEDWPNHKPNMKWGTAPMFEDGELCLGQGVAISRYIAEKYGFAGKTNMEKYEIDATVDTIIDFMTPFGKAMFSKDEEEKKKGLEDFRKGAPMYVGILAKKLESNGGKYMVGDDFTMVDFGIYNVIFGLKSIEMEGSEELMETLKPLNAVYDNVAALPNIQKWVEARPETKF